MSTKSLAQCHGCRLTWFPQGGAAGCPACGGTRIGGTFQLFHAGLVLIALGLVGWFFRHGPLSERAAAATPAIVQTRQPTPTADGAPQVVSATKLKPNKVKVKRRQKKAKTRSKHVQR
jgi:hypothetical protein